VSETIEQIEVFKGKSKEDQPGPNRDGIPKLLKNWGAHIYSIVVFGEDNLLGTVVSSMYVNYSPGIAIIRVVSDELRSGGIVQANRMRLGRGRVMLFKARIVIAGQEMLKRQFDEVRNRCNDTLSTTEELGHKWKVPFAEIFLKYLRLHQWRLLTFAQYLLDRNGLAIRFDILTACVPNFEGKALN